MLLCETPPPEPCCQTRQSNWKMWVQGITPPRLADFVTSECNSRCENLLQIGDQFPAKHSLCPVRYWFIVSNILTQNISTQATAPINSPLSRRRAPQPAEEGHYMTNGQLLFLGRRLKDNTVAPSLSPCCSVHTRCLFREISPQGLMMISPCFSAGGSCCWNVSCRLSALCCVKDLLVVVLNRRYPI